MEALYFEDYSVGQEFDTLRRTVTEVDVGTFVGMAAFYSPMFMDLEYVQNDSYYPGRLVPGILTASLAEGLLIHLGIVNDRGLALMEMNIQFKGPVFVGDTIFARVRVESVRLTSKPDRGVVVTGHSVVNQKGVVVLHYTVTRMIKTRQWNEQSAITKEKDAKK